MGTKVLKLIGMDGTGMWIGQIGMGTLIVIVFPFSHPPKSVFDLINL